MSIEVAAEDGMVVILVGDKVVCGMMPDTADFIADELRRYAAMTRARLVVSPEDEKNA